MLRNSITLPPLATLGNSAAALIEQAGDDRPTVNAINKALWYLSGGLEIVPVAGGFLMPSGTRNGIIHRVSSAGECGCEAGKNGRKCWHVCALTLIEDAQRYTMPSLARPSYAEAVAALDELF